MKLNFELMDSLYPYKLRKIDDLTFRFVTDQGVHYKMGFYPEPAFMKEGAYHFFIELIEGTGCKGKKQRIQSFSNSLSPEANANYQL